MPLTHLEVTLVSMAELQAGALVNTDPAVPACPSETAEQQPSMLNLRMYAFDTLLHNRHQRYTPTRGARHACTHEMIYTPRPHALENAPRRAEHAYVTRRRRAIKNLGQCDTFTV